MNNDLPVTRCETVFADELALVRDHKIREFVVNVFEALCPDEYWTQPASTSGKYHPQVSSGEGGLVRHTKLAVWWGLELAKALGLESLNDKTVATLLLHDVLKRKDNVGTHGLELAHLVREHARRLCNQDDSWVTWSLAGTALSRIADGISYHMGKWTTGGVGGVAEEHQDFCRLVHLADYCASRKVDAKLTGLEKR